MNRKRLIFCIGLISLFSFSALIAADDPFLELLKKLEELTKKHPIERAYLHLDKPYYAVGDDIWFKAYVTDGRTAAPTSISNIIYVELINQNDSLIKLLKLPMQGGLANGEFKLEDNLQEGNYRIRAYTQWMRNAGPDFFFDKTIKIGNSWANLVFTSADYQYTPDKSGNIKGALKFLNKTGQPFTGHIVNYDVQLEGKSILKGKNNTDANGLINVNIANDQLGHKQGKIIATIVMPNGQFITKTIPIKFPSIALDVQFFAEGGNLIDNLPCKIAIKAINTNGLGENVSGTIVDNEGNEVLNFETTYLGMGNFTLTPGEGKTYKAKIKLANGSEKEVELPKSQKSGYALTVNNTDTAKISIKVMLSPDLLNKGELNLIAQHGGNVFFTTKVATTKQISTVIVRKKEIPSGIVQLSLFNPENSPISERLIFVDNLNDKIALSSNNIKASYNKKGNVNFTVEALNNNSPVQGSFSIAVTNADIVTPDLENETNILTGLLLSSDLKGYIEKPNHYFLNNDSKILIELDNLMLTQGWRKIDWIAVASSEQSLPTFPPEKGLSISGKVTKGKAPIAKGKITLMSSSKVKLVATTETDEKGHFSFDDAVFGDSIRFVLQAGTKDDKKDVTVKLDKIGDQNVTFNRNAGDIEVNVNTSLTTYLKESEDYFEDQNKKGFLNRTNQLKTVNIVSKTPKKEDSASVNSSNLNGRGRANFIITAKDLEHTYDLTTYLRSGRVPGVTVSTNPDLRNIPLTTRFRSLPVDPTPENPYGTDPPFMAISIDGMVLTQYSADDISLIDIETIEVLTDVSLSALYGIDGYNGLLVITTKRGGGRKISDINAPGMVIFMPKGYDTPRKFYSPKYDANPDTKQDLRTTVFWEPHLITDKNGKAIVNYYNTDQAGSYRIVIEGIDATGNLARKVMTYQIK
jgi:hypothetical protein